MSQFHVTTLDKATGKTQEQVIGCAGMTNEECIAFVENGHKRSPQPERHQIVSIKRLGAENASLAPVEPHEIYAVNKVEAAEVK